MANDRYEQRQYLGAGVREISPEAYNMIIGGVLLYGFLVNCFMVRFGFDMAYNIIVNNYFAYLIGYFVMIFIGSMLIHKSDNPVISFIGYNFIVLPLGLILSFTLNVYVMAGYSSTITLAFGITAAVTFIMMVLSSINPGFFLSLGRVLVSSLLITVIIELILYFMGVQLGIIDYIMVLIFCGYIGYDWARANSCAKTVDNAIDCASDLYVDIVVLFMRILRILARAQRN